MATDLFALINESSRGGHAGASSTWSYIHRVESPIARLARAARRQDISFELDDALTKIVFTDVTVGLLQEREPALPEAEQELERTTCAWQLTLAQRADIASRLTAGETMVEAAAHCSVPREIACEVAREVVQALIDGRLADASSLRSEASTLLALRARRTWSRASRQSKYRPLEERLGAAVVAGRLQELREVTLAWLSCAEGNDLSLEGAGPEIVNYLRAAGIGARQMAVTTPVPTSQWPQSVRRLGLQHRSGKERAGQPAYRLSMTERSVNAATGRAATVSVVGVSWWLAIVRSALLSLVKRVR
jgi:hypothetical protein